MNTLRIVLIITALMLPQTALPEDQAVEKAGEAPAVKESAETAADAPAEMSYVGTVAEATIAGSYLYIKMDMQGEELWLATNPSFPGGKVEVGEKLEFSGGFEMTDFKSKALDRTFDKILFITKIRKFDAKPISDFEHVPADQLHTQYTKANTPAQAPSPGEIKKLENGITVEELLLGKDKLAESEVMLRARVMKVSKNILKKNWITLQDGTGKAPDNAIVATSSEMADPGDTVTVKGILKTDMDLGSGYRYKAIIEDAKFTKE